MDCACLPLLYMDRELVWRSVILFSQTLPSAMPPPPPLFRGGRISPVFTPYSSSAPRMTRLDDPESWWRRWISLSFFPSLLSSSVSPRKDSDLLQSDFSCKISAFQARSPFRVFDPLDFFFFFVLFYVAIKDLYTLHVHYTRYMLVIQCHLTQTQVATSRFSPDWWTFPRCAKSILYKFAFTSCVSSVHNRNCDFVTSQREWYLSKVGDNNPSMCFVDIVTGTLYRVVKSFISFTNVL